MTEYSISRLEEICKNELVSRTVKEVYWLDSAGRLAFEFESVSSHEVHLVYGCVDWDLFTLADHEIIASDREGSSEFRAIAERLAGKKITAVEVRPEGSLALWLTFDNEIQLQSDVCKPPEYDLQAPCWQLFCADGYVIDVGKPAQSWHRSHKSASFWS